MIVFVDKSNNPMINPKEEYHRVRKKHLVMNSLSQTILEIVVDWTLRNESGKQMFSIFGISKYGQYSIF